MAILTGSAIAAVGNDTTRSTTALNPLGFTAYDSLGNEYTYIKAGATIAVNDAVRFQGSALGFDDVRPTSAINQIVLGAATAAFAANEYGFVLSKGVATVKVVNATAALSPLVTNATAGTLALADATAFGLRPAVALVTGVTAGSGVALL